MGNNWIRAPLFVLAIVLLFGWTGEIVYRASGRGTTVALSEEVNAANGEQIFWSAGKCHTCHSVGTRGSSIRGPNLGASAIGPELATRATLRASERSETTGRSMTATEYIVESIANPSAFVVDGFKDEMPLVYDPPILLGPGEISSVVLYLQSLGGVPDPGAITLPPEIRDAGQRVSSRDAWEPYLDGDSIKGHDIFFDLDGAAACSKCHTVDDLGGDVGPELTSVAGTRTVRFILESILKPSAEIAGGYESILVQTRGGRILDGVLRRETGDSLWLANSDGEVIGMAVADIARRREQETSLMPDNLAEVLTVAELHDLLAFLQTLR